MSRPEQTENPDAPEQPAEESGKLGLVIDGRYRIIELVGRGGMGTVFKAEHIGIGRTVAVKLLHPSLAGVPEIAKRFEREALAIGRIGHPNCVDVTDSGKLDDGSLFLVMEYCEGQSVGDLLADSTRVEPTRALHIMRHMLRGLGHAHEANIVHRDIKPENIILVDQDGDPDFAKILDFGIAKLVGSTEKDSVKLTQAGVAFGTPVYMSPEQAVGNPVDGRADLYAATVVLYEMLAGQPPFYSDDKIEILSMHTTREPPLFSQTPAAGISPAIEAVVMRGLAKRPGDRYANADEYIAAINAVLAGAPGPGKIATTIPKRSNTVPVLYGPPPITTAQVPQQPPVDRRKLFLLLGGVAALIFLAIVVAATRGGGGGGDDAPEMAAAEAAMTATERAAELLAAGNAEGAINLLEGQHEITEQDAPAQLLLGHAYAASERERDSLRAYERALTLDGDGAVADARLRENLQGLLASKNVELALDAADILLGKLNDEKAADRLVVLAAKAEAMETRWRARELAEKHSVADRVDLVESFARDLVQGNRCEDRRKVVKDLLELGDRRAIPHLKKARYRRSSNRKYRGQNINGCLTEEADKAIAALSKLRDQPATGAGDKSP